MPKVRIGLTKEQEGEDMKSTDLFEMMMGLDVVHDRKTGYILNHKMKKPEYKFVEFDKGKLHYD